MIFKTLVRFYYLFYILTTSEPPPISPPTYSCVSILDTFICRAYVPQSSKIGCFPFPHAVSIYTSLGCSRWNAWNCTRCLCLTPLPTPQPVLMYLYLCEFEDSPLLSLMLHSLLLDIRFLSLLIIFLFCQEIFSANFLIWLQGRKAKRVALCLEDCLLVDIGLTGARVNCLRESSMSRQHIDSFLLRRGPIIRRN